ncbi:30S ribosome-binding factor RbfA [Ponticaulis sp.]|uniref:30S ribosome-binding factor RbfA n=1 Tax=Ponticaulis sp. TaxID=2020902 RepID=UPI000B66D3A1|nr:30S ribosome-binding factor RbfA [Ponticaulis sp.]MAI91136.1 ribosome-binding factor A [Ponticaulis sp.]OUX98452.1 MAG: ribosome-binding factor A [Hyphomonadaceae bacterium TMED5]|tara:strand:- start:615 stop:1022 length:408 start_codon:yes stop_codon:yes gene_type:complete
MNKRHSSSGPVGPSQRQLRAGELVRHALVDILAREEFRDPALQGVSVTIGEVRTSPDLKHAVVFCSPLVGSSDAKAVADALNRASSFLRGKLGRQIDMKFTPQLRFLADQSYDEATAMDKLLDSVAEREGFDEEE